MARTSVLAAGGIVLQRDAPARIALASARSVAASEMASEPTPEPAIAGAVSAAGSERRSLVQRVRNWLRRAA
jgi:hypothetical protein